MRKYSEGIVRIYTRDSFYRKERDLFKHATFIPF